MRPELSWLIGKILIKAYKQDYTWGFVFDEQGSIFTDTLWRLVTSEHIRVASGDHEQWFGLAQPVDAGQWVMEVVQGQAVADVVVDDVTLDLKVVFGSGAALHFLNTSCGYESWRVGHVLFGEIMCHGQRLLRIAPAKDSGDPRIVRTETVD